MQKHDNNNQFEIEFYQKLVEEKPDYVDALIPLAHAYTKIGQHKKGLEIDQRLAELKPEDPIIFYNLACSYSLSGQCENAIKALGRAIELGYNDAKYMLDDPDLDNIKERLDFKNLLKKHFQKTT